MESVGFEPRTSHTSQSFGKVLRANGPHIDPCYVYGFTIYLSLCYMYMVGGRAGA
jgi:hypothetical protein